MPAWTSKVCEELTKPSTTQALARMGRDCLVRPRDHSCSSITDKAYLARTQDVHFSEGDRLASTGDGKHLRGLTPGQATGHTIRRLQQEHSMKGKARELLSCSQV